MPMPLFVAAPIKPATWVPCQLLELAGSPALHSFALVQSPGSVGSLSRPVPSLAVVGAPPRSRPMKSYPGCSLPCRSGCSGRTPVSSTATTTDADPVVDVQAPTALMADATSPDGARRYHWPTTGVALRWLSANKASLGKLPTRRRSSTTAHSTSGKVRRRRTSSELLKPCDLSACVWGPKTRPSVRGARTRLAMRAACRGAVLAVPASALPLD